VCCVLDYRQRPLTAHESKMVRGAYLRQLVLLTFSACCVLLLLHSAATGQITLSSPAVAQRRPPDRVTGPDQPAGRAPGASYEPDPATGVCSGPRFPPGLPPLYVITPTYRRAEQLAELTRTGQTLLHADALVWIVAEDASKPTEAVLEYLRRSGLCWVYLRAQMPAQFLKVKNKPRGVANRNAALAWLRQHARSGGALYFADDDNAYDRRLFEEIRHTRRVAMFPVGLVTKLGVSSPIVRGGKVVGFYDGWLAGRKFAVDMAGFAVNVNHFLSCPDATMPFVAGREETKFLEGLKITKEDIEVMASNCTQIMVWHTRTQKNDPAKDPPKSYDIANSNVQALRAQLWKGTR